MILIFLQDYTKFILIIKTFNTSGYIVITDDHQLHDHDHRNRYDHNH